MKIGKRANGSYYWSDHIDNVRVIKQSSKWKKESDVKKAHQAYLMNYAREKEESKKTENKFKTIANLYLDRIEISKSSSTHYGYQKKIEKHILPFFGNEDIRDIDLASIEQFQKKLVNKKFRGKHYSNKTLLIIQTLLSQIFEYAIVHDYIDSNPYKKAIPAQRNDYQEEKSITILTKEEYESFMSVVTDEIAYSLYTTLYWTGMRIGEALALNIEDVDFKNKQIHILKNWDSKKKKMGYTKGRKKRIIDIPDQCINVLQKQIDRYKQSVKTLKGEHILFGLYSRLVETTYRRLLKEYIEFANEDSMEYNEEYGTDFNLLSNFSYHTFRHTHVSILIELGLNANDIADRLGHSVHEVNETYGHLFPSRKKMIIGKLNDL